MAGRRIVWTLQARQERRDILAYWKRRNKSSLYSKKLRKLILDEALYIARHPFSGKATSISNIYYSIVKDYLIFYKESENEVTILSVWDGRRNPRDLEDLFE